MKKHKKHGTHKHSDTNDRSATSSLGSPTTSYNEDTPQTDSIETPQNATENRAVQQLEQIFWSKSTNDEEKSREEEFDDYLANLLL